MDQGVPTPNGARMDVGSGDSGDTAEIGLFQIHKMKYGHSPKKRSEGVGVKIGVPVSWVQV